MTKRIWGIVLVVALAGCGATSAADKETTLPTRDITAAKEKTPEQLFTDEMARGDAHFAKRHQLEELSKAIGAYQAAAKINPNDPEVWTKLARSYYLWADGFLSFEKEKSDEAMEKFMKTHEQGIVYAKRSLLANSQEFQKKMQAEEKMEEAIKVLDKSAAPAMYWMAANYGKWGVARGFTTILRYKDMIKEIMDTVHKLAPEYFFGAADRYLGAYYAKLPSIAGQDLDKSMKHFKASLSTAPNYFGTKVLMAEYWAKNKDDRASFEKWLKEVIEGDPESNPGCSPENRIEQKKAQRLLANIDEIF
jgi:tetratricopeptide (TPR) repeat protein